MLFGGSRISQTLRPDCVCFRPETGYAVRVPDRRSGRGWIDRVQLLPVKTMRVASAF